MRVTVTILHMREGVPEQVTGLLAVIYLVPQPGDLSHSDGDGGGVGLQGRRGHAQRQRIQSKLSWFTQLASVGPGQGPWPHTRADPAVSRA